MKMVNGVEWHAAAAAAFTLLLNSRARLVSTEAVLLECGNADARRPNRDDIVELRIRLAETGALFQPTADELERAWQDYRAKTTGVSGIVDNLSFLLMRRLNLSVAFTNDKHFIKAGFQVLF